MKGSKPKMMPKGKMSSKGKMNMSKWEGSPMDRKMDAKGIKAFNAKKRKK